MQKLFAVVPCELCSTCSSGQPSYQFLAGTKESRADMAFARKRECQQDDLHSAWSEVACCAKRDRRK